MQWMVMLNKDGTKSICHSDLNNHLAHYGLPRRSGRYKWGSGKEPYQSLRVRRYQNSDGSLTKVGAKRYQYQRTLNDLDKKGTKTVAKYMKTEHRIYNDITKLKKQHQRYAGHPTERNNKRMEKTERKIDANFDKRDKCIKSSKAMIPEYGKQLWQLLEVAIMSMVRQFTETTTSLRMFMEHCLECQVTSVSRCTIKRNMLRDTTARHHPLLPDTNGR